MALSTDTPRDYGVGDPRSVNEIPVRVSTLIYEGAFVGDDAAGRARGLVASDPFLGIAWRQADNSAGAAGAIGVELVDQGTIEIAVTGVTGVGDVGDDVYATDDGTLNKAGAAASVVGTIVRWVSGTTCVVAFQGVPRRSV